jgi:pyridoxal phosphate enzyme (YggS family)
MSIAENFDYIRQRITSAALRAGRNPGEIRLVAVSKTQSAGAVVEAAQAGQRLFGENYVQELTAKAVEVAEPVEWHFIGSLQSNKVKYLVDLVTMIHSVDRLSLAEEISRQWGKAGKSCDILLEVNIAGEATKGGTAVDALLVLTRDVARLSHLRIRGLMTMPPFFDEPEAARPYFCELRRLAAVITAAGIPGVEMKELSMGMSGDFEAAIEEGATLVRVGTALFGERSYHR